jgi:hypothetical protein
VPTYDYDPRILAQLALHGVRPQPATPPASLRAFLNDLYRYEIRRLRDRLRARDFPSDEYIGRVTALRDKYWLLSLPVVFWTAGTTPTVERE